MDSGVSVAAAALAVGLVALLVATAQLLQQVFGTADGYRRCQPSVIGPWARKTRLVWRWTQFRFETKFTTPEIVLYSHRQQFAGLVDLHDRALPPELHATIHAPAADEAWDGDAVTWTTFLRQLYRQQPAWHGGTPRVASDVGRPTTADKPRTHGAPDPSSIGVIYRERTWDLMPVDTVRPMASSRLGTIVVLAHRLGMRWESVQHADGFLRAEGHGHSLVSSMARSLGIVFQYNFTRENASANRTSPAAANGILSTAADKMACGIVPGCRTLDLPDLPLARTRVEDTAAAVLQALTDLGVRGSTVEQLTRPQTYTLLKRGDGWALHEAFPLNDLIALMAPFMPTASSRRTSIVWPLQATVSLTAFHFKECRQALLERLASHPGVTSGTRRHLAAVYERYRSLEKQFGDDFYCRWDRSIVHPANPTADARPALIRATGEIHAWTTDYFLGRERGRSYRELVAAHVTLALHAAADARAAHPRDNIAFWLATPQRYVDRLPHLVAEMHDTCTGRGQTPPSRETIEDAWWTLLLRGTAWFMSIYPVYPDYWMPSNLYYDQTPVYIL